MSLFSRFTSIIVIIVMFFLIRLIIIHRRPLSQISRGTAPQHQNGEAYVNAVNTINYLITDVRTGHKRQFTAGDAADLETALSLILGTAVTAQPITGDEVRLAIQLANHHAVTLSVKIVATDLKTAALFDRDQATTVTVDQTPVANGRECYNVIKQTLKRA
ncbi:hypothetical protein RA086_05750 [Lactiplantibacillus sp. WILCCON 0030]|uniref:Uncharacterized protein n=1 Tax=Lactiplantibacillus brownii TaxID=3069269 RepID=A0ABU1A856_9LACO|nr:hypothetical protein [Lactiplantibacillus brownii]MDQ7937131.1 hypothetical protein [Lactiplantibacillus brownii]